MFTKFMHFVKMSWMFTWRIFLLQALLMQGGNEGFLISVAVVAAGILAFVFNKAVTTWPIIRFLRKRPIVYPADTFGGEKASPKPRVRRKDVTRAKEAAQSPKRGIRTPGVPIKSATEDGRMTGFEPSALELHPVPNSARMVGVPGGGLHDSEAFEERNLQAGIKGEENFARALATTAQLSRFSTIWSVPVMDPNKFQLSSYKTDIDCILATGDTIFLVDLKNYKSGNLAYFNHDNLLYCEDVATGRQVGEPKVMSRNMEMATQALRNHFPNASITPVIVFMPTDKGEAVLENVTWPGNIRAMNLTSFLSMLATQPPFTWKESHAGAVGRMATILNMERPKDVEDL